MNTADLPRSPKISVPRRRLQDPSLPASTREGSRSAVLRCVCSPRSPAKLRDHGTVPCSNPGARNVGLHSALQLSAQPGLLERRGARDRLHLSVRLAAQGEGKHLVPAGAGRRNELAQPKVRDDSCHQPLSRAPFPVRGLAVLCLSRARERESGRTPSLSLGETSRLVRWFGSWREADADAA